MTLTTDKGAHQGLDRNRGTAAVDLSDEDENGKRGSSEQSGCKHGVGLAIADPTPVEARAEMHGRRSNSSAKKLRASSDFRRWRREEDGLGPAL